MNITALFDSISLDKARIGNFLKGDISQIKKQLLAQKEINSEITDSDIAALLKALKSNPASFEVVLNNRILFNFFAKKDYPRKYFRTELDFVEIRKVKSFVDVFLANELKVFFTQNLEANKFSAISHLAEAQHYFPDSLNDSLKNYSLSKLNDAITILKPTYGNISKVLYIKDSHFFTFLNHIKDDEIEQKIMDLSLVITEFCKQDQNSELANKTFLAMNEYHAFDDDFAQKIAKNKDIADTKFEAYIPKKRNLTWVYVTVGFFVFIRIVFFVNTINFNKYTNDNVTYDEEIDYKTKSEAKKIDRYYTNMKFTIDSFRIFLADYKKLEIKQITQDISLKTGENPFQTFYQNEPAGESNNFIKVKNNTGYDMVLLENTVLYDSIKMPQSAHYIKTGDILEINFKHFETKTVFNLYLGKKWATFQTNSKHLFIRNHSIVEYRFSELIPAAMDILKTDYSFQNDATISYSKSGLNIDSKNTKINPLSETQK